MKPEVQHFIDQAYATASRGRRMVAASLFEDAGRAAYLVCFHAAQAVIFETTGRVAKTHRGVHSEYHRSVKDDPCVDATPNSFLSQAYEYKSEADYFNTLGFVISGATAAAAMNTAERFLAQAESFVARASAPDQP